jgi:hypothetical protein
VQLQNRSAGKLDGQNRAILRTLETGAVLSRDFESKSREKKPSVVTSIHIPRFPSQNHLAENPDSQSTS